MKKNILFLLFIILLNVNSTNAFSYNFYTSNIPEDSVKKRKDVNNDTTSKLYKFNHKMEKMVNYFPLPVISYSTETNWLIGLTKFNSFRMGTKNQKDTTIQPSQITATAYFTLNKQYKIVAESKLMFGHNKYTSNTQLLFYDYPANYYGTGNDTKREDEFLLDVVRYSATQSFGYNITNKLYVALKYEIASYTKVDSVKNPVKPIDPKFTNLKDNEGLQSGIGFTFSREGRDNRFNATRGSYLFLEFMNYGKWIGSEFGYNTITLDARKYYTPFKWLTVGGQLYTEVKEGDVPVQSLALMGGDNRMRGIFNGRYRDKGMIETQVEARIPIWWIFGGVIFAGAGQSFPDYSKFSWDRTKIAYGAGLRVMVNSATRANIRFDVGVHDSKALFFFTFSEAF